MFAEQSTRRLPRRQRGHRQRRRASRACDPQPCSSSREETRLRKIGKLTDQGDIDQDALDSSTHQTLGAAAVQGRIALGPKAGAYVPRDGQGSQEPREFRRGPLCAASRDGTVRVWTIDGALLTTIRGHTGFVYDACFDADGRTILSAGSEGTTRLWHALPDDLLAAARARLHRDFDAEERARYGHLLPPLVR